MKRRKMSKYTEMTLKKLKKDGYGCGIVERFIPRAGFGFRKDLFGIIDIIAIKEGEIIGVQSCGATYAEHFEKITVTERENAINWLKAGGKLHLYAWRKLKKKRGGKATYWDAKIKIFVKNDF